MILDVYRSLAALAAHPPVDATRIAVMGFSRGAQAALYSSLKRFQKIWNPGGIEPTAYVALYPPCNMTFIDDTEVSEHPILMLHGVSDDYVPITPCRNYFERLQKSAKNVKMIEFPDTWHAFDFPNFPSSPVVAQDAQTTLCALREEPVGTIMNTETKKPFTYNNSCVGKNPHIAYSATSTHAAEVAVKTMLTTAFRLN